MSFLSKLLRNPALKLTQNLGAYPLRNGDISPLYIFLNVENTGDEAVEITSVRISPKGEELTLEGEEFEDKVPVYLGAGESVRFEVRAKTLARSASDAGYSGRPRLSFFVADGRGNECRRDFRLRVDEYLGLKDE